ncbi:MAG: hypothetical protein U0073_14145 [Bacteroidia bacterium]
MNIFLRMKHWQLFLLMVGIPIIIEFIGLGIMFTTRDPKSMFFVFPLIMFFSILINLGWLNALGINLTKKLPETVKMKLNKFKWFLYFPMIYMLILSVFILGILNGLSFGLIPTPLLLLLILPIHLFSMFCLFYCLYYISKTLKAVELQRPVIFNDYAGEFFLLWFFPIGLWIIQPRINKLFAESSTASVLSL